MPIPRQDGTKFMPGLGEQIEWGLKGVGFSVVSATIAADHNTARTDAQLIASPANTNANVNACGPIVHSLGTPPAFAFLELNGPVGGSVQVPGVRFVTADNSALYFRAKYWTAGELGYSVRAFAIR